MADKKEQQGGPEEDAENTVTTKPVSSSNGGESSGRGGAEKRSASPEDASSQPCPSKLSKFGFAIGGQTGKKAPSISIKLSSPDLKNENNGYASSVTRRLPDPIDYNGKPKDAPPAVVPKKSSVAAVFNEDDSEPEEMPPEAKMRMKNIGRDTPTSAGPNSFNKGKHGFSDSQKLWERNLKSQTEHVPDD